MRRKGQPSRPSATTCCFFCSLKTLLTSTEGSPSRPSQCPASAPLAGFQVTLIGRFWVTPEVCPTQTTWDQEGFPIRDPDSTTYTGAIETAEEFGRRLYVEAWKRGWSRAKNKVVIGDEQSGFGIWPPITSPARSRSSISTTRASTFGS